MINFLLRISSLIILLTALLTFGCTTTVPNTTMRFYKYNIKDKKVVIIPFKLNEDSALRVNKSFAKSLKEGIAFDIKSHFYKNGFSRIKIKKDYTGSDYIVSGKITQIEGGNLAQRAWFGFGYGASIITIEGFLIDVKHTEKVIEFRITETDEWTYSDNENSIRNLANYIAKEIVKIIIEYNGKK